MTTRPSSVSSKACSDDAPRLSRLQRHHATEANNLALLGVALALPDKRHLVISAVEHPAVMQPARHFAYRRSRHGGTSGTPAASADDATPRRPACAVARPLASGDSRFSTQRPRRAGAAENQHCEALFQYGAAHATNTAIQVVCQSRIHHNGKPKTNPESGTGDAATHLVAGFVGRFKTFDLPASFTPIYASG